MESMHYWGKAMLLVNLLALEEFIPWKAENGEVSWENRHG